VIVAPLRKITETIQVHRALPTAKRRSVGPFVFFDQMGPATLEAIDVPPHPHIGLATVTYLFEGELLHRDSLGSVQPIKAGAVNWMTAGRGIAHSERTPDERRGMGQKMSGVQLWAAVPHTDEVVGSACAYNPVGASM